MRQIYIPFVALALFGCAQNQGALESRLVQAEAKQRQLSGEIERLEQEAHNVAKDASVCEKVSEYANDVREGVVKAYNVAKPVIVQGVTDAYTWAKKEVQEHTTK